jgi:hypothetical protein
MKQKPTTPEGLHEAARILLANKGYKIFTPRWQYFRQKHQFIAAQELYGIKTYFLLQLRNNTHVFRYLPPTYGNPSVIALMEKELGIKIIKGKPLFRLYSDDPWEDGHLYIKPGQTFEFKQEV